MKGKEIITADFHLGSGYLYGSIDTKTGNNSRLDDTLDCISQITEYAKKEKIDRVVFLGDAYKEGNGIADTKRMEMFSNCIKELSSICNVDIVVGNHDIYNDTNVYFDIKTWLPENVRVFDKPTFDEKTNSFMLPYFNIKNAITPENIKNKTKEEINLEISKQLEDVITGMAQKMDEREPIYSYFHFTILNSEYKEGVITKWGQDIIISSEVLDTYFLKSFGGHLHNPQQIGNCYYAGSIMPVERREKQKSFIVHDREAKTVERIEINHRDIIDLPIDAGVLLKKENYLQNYNKKDIIRINIYGNSSDISKLNINKIKDFYKDSHWLRVFINPDKAEESKTKIDSNILELSDRNILKKYFKESNEKNIKKILSVYDKTIL